MMESKKRLIKNLYSMGCKARFKPYWDSESESVMLEVRNPAKIIDGLLVGSEIDVYDQSTFRVWTSQKRKAIAYARQYGLRIHKLSHECEIFVPACLADQLLHAFGAKITRTLSDSHKDKLQGNWF